MLFSYNNTTCEGFVPSIAPLLISKLQWEQMHYMNAKGQA